MIANEIDPFEIAVSIKKLSQNGKSAKTSLVGHEVLNATTTFEVEPKYLPLPDMLGNELEHWCQVSTLEPRTTDHDVTAWRGVNRLPNIPSHEFRPIGSV